MTAVLLNTITVIIGGLLGLIIRKNVKSVSTGLITEVIAIVVLVMSIQGAIQTQNMMLVLVSMIIGTVIGEALKLEKGISSIADKLRNRFSKEDNQFTTGFITTVMVQCVGAMSILGSIEAGLGISNDTLYFKAVLDFFSSIAFASTYGVGAIFSAVVIFLYQGSIALMANVIAPFLTEIMVAEISAVGNVIMVALSLNMLNLKSYRIVNMLPAMLGPVIYFLIAG